MTCVAVTRGGWGDFWLFDTAAEADLHPLIQYGDAILAGPDDVVKQYNTLEIGRFLTKLKQPDLRAAVMAHVDLDLLPPRKKLEVVVQYSEKIWDRMVQLAKTPPARPVDICNLIREDRTQMIQEGRMAKAELKTDGEKATKAKAAPKPKADKAAAPAAAKAPRPPKYRPDQVILMGTDKEGKKYDGKTNNPKRSGSKRAALFVHLKDGMTVAAFVKACGDQAAAFNTLTKNEAKKFLRVADKTA